MQKRIWCFGVFVCCSDKTNCVKRAACRKGICLWLIKVSSADATTLLTIHNICELISHFFQIAPDLTLSFTKTLCVQYGYGWKWIYIYIFYCSLPLQNHTWYGLSPLNPMPSRAARLKIDVFRYCGERFAESQSVVKLWTSTVYPILTEPRSGWKEAEWDYVGWVLADEICWGFTYSPISTNTKVLSRDASCIVPSQQGYLTCGFLFTCRGELLAIHLLSIGLASQQRSPW